MPLYDYRCAACSKTFELLVRNGTVPSCPTCGGERLEKQVALPVSPGKTGGILARARRQAASEGHFSNYKASERPRG